MAHALFVEVADMLVKVALAVTLLLTIGSRPVTAQDTQDQEYKAIAGDLFVGGADHSDDTERGTD